ncbi:ATP-binding protein [Rhizobium straminoryzae]|uniref:AAA family ATPase n=1 Tax=Rhizobium straminoryzae TaxID=1387186 RepID=A0A549SXS4_9HYPH|nr:AAA family ATPase [Rhizobium straminoryzae]TRL34348.1 AAA family ATPase [Rhizobium straminoryzae]
MRLRRLDLTRYGKFTDQAIDFGPAISGAPDLHIVYGLNEAGKSTAFSAYLDLLFGIPERSGYNFLHAYNAMQVGAVLEFDGAEHPLVRLKQRSQALVDPRGQPVNEALLSSALGGISRESYRTMFSLDDRSLRDGGAAILESKGDLGEMLFSASSGLADISRVLAAASEEAHQFHRKRARNTALAELKQQLAALKTEREAIDTYASAYAGLVATQAQADKAYAEVLAELSAARTRQAHLVSLQRALPLSRELARLSAEADAHADLPRPPREWAALLPELMRDETRLQTRSDGLDAAISRLEQDLAAITPDAAVLSLSARIAALDDGRARYQTAENDLPKRRLALSEQDAALGRALSALGQPAGTDAAGLVLPAALSGTLRDLIETRSGIAATRVNAAREMERVRLALGDLEARLDQQGGGTTPSAALMRRLDSAVAALQKGELQTRLRSESRSSREVAENLQRALDRLQPWQGDVEELAGQDGADARQIDSWRQRAAEIERRAERSRERQRELATRLAEVTARLKAVQGAGPAIDDAAATAARAARDAAWQVHRARLDGESAEQFEEKLGLDDRLAEARLARASDLAELRQLQQEAELCRVGLAREEALVDEAAAEMDALRRSVEGAFPFPVSATVEMASLLSRLDEWRLRRSEALSLTETLRQAEARRRACKDDLDEALDRLRIVLEELGWPVEDGADPRLLIDGAADRLAELQTTLAERRGMDNRLADLRRDLSERQRDLAEAEAAEARWSADWSAALARTWFGHETDPAAVRAILDALADLPAILREREQLFQRIQQMERDMQAFAVEVDALRDTLHWPDEGLSPRDLAGQLAARKAEAERERDRESAKAEDLRHAQAERADLQRAIDAHRTRRQDLLDFFGVETLVEASLQLQRAAERDHLERRLGELRANLLGELKVATLPEADALLAEADADAVAREADELSERIDNLAERSRMLFAELTRARDRVDAVGGDDAVAKLEARRSTLLLDIEERALSYLKLRAGTLAAESALSLYRERHRSSMMKRASEAFRQITRGDYSGLAALPDKDREVLIGVARDGASRLSEVMSTGTRYQLYLALRLAGYEELAAVRAPVPFIADDIMETFDELRSEEVFRLFGQMAQLGQVIYLTHHRHLCEIAQAVVPEVRIHTL